MTKPIIVVKMPGYKLLYIIQVKGFSWPYLILKILIAITIATMLLLIGLVLLLIARLFLFSISLLFVVISKP